MVSEKDCIISNERGLSEIFKEHFINIAKTLDLKSSIISTTTSLEDHTSIKKTFSLRREEWQFKFHSVSENEVRRLF